MKRFWNEWQEYSHKEWPSLRISTHWAPNPTYAPSKSALGSSAPQEIEAGLITVQIPRDDVRSSLSNIQLPMAASSLSPDAGDGKSDGFYVVSPGPQNILPRLGLLPGDLIMGMDGVHYEDTEDADTFFQKLADGGNFSILVQRGDRIQNLHVVIN